MKSIRSKLIICFFLFLFIWVCPVISSWADPLDNWTQRTSGTNSSLYGITYGNGMFVAVGQGGTILTSTGGTNWTARSSGTGAVLADVTYGDGTFVAVGYGGRFVTSTNGINWTYMNPFPAISLPVSAITYGNGLFVAVGYWDLVFTSPDGFNWTKRSSGVRYSLNCIAYGNGRFVAGGDGGRGLTSTDGINWTPMSLWFAPNGIFSEIVYGKGIFVATVTLSIGSNASTIAYSPNGINWNYQAPPSNTFYLRGVTYGNYTFVIVTHSWPNNVITSPDCCHWTARTADQANFIDVAYGDNTFVAVGPLGTIFQSDPVGGCTLPVGHNDYCRDCGPCSEGQGDCDTNSECESGLNCVQVLGTDYCQSVGGCTLPAGHLDYCSDPACGPCGIGEGDCDTNSECESGLNCVQVIGTDYCQSVGGCTLPAGHLDYCSDPACGPCGIGEGDCDTNSECESGLNCVQVIGTDYCQSVAGCTLPAGHLDYCSDPKCGPCAAGEGDCDTNSECQSGLSCVQVPGTDVCCPHPIGHLDYCRDCGPCAAGQGDCDNDSECQSGLTCVQVPGTDTCQ